jgi:hypothetical protein
VAVAGTGLLTVATYGLCDASLMLALATMHASA